MRLRTAASAAAFAVGALSLVGCGGSSEDSNATSQPATAISASAATSDTAATGFDPCALPEVDLAAAGLDPSSKHVGAAGVRIPGWDACSWRGQKTAWYGLNVYSTGEHTYDEAIHNTTLYRDPQPVKVAGRDATQLYSATDDHDCTIIFDATGGPVSFQVSAKLSADNPGDACAEASRIAGSLVKDVPNIE